MANMDSKVLVTIILVALLSQASATNLCNIDSTKLAQCLPALTGKSPKPPTPACCEVVHHANLPCFCSYLSVLPAYGIDPAHAVELPKKCGRRTPRECHGKSLNHACMISLNVLILLESSQTILLYK